MSDSEDDNGAFYSGLVELRKNSTRRNKADAKLATSAPARGWSELLLSNGDNGQQSISVDTGVSADESGSGLPNVDDVMAAADTSILRSYERIQEDKQRSQATTKSNKVESTSAVLPSLFKLPDITWHVPMTSFEFLKSEKERVDRDARAKVLKRERHERIDIRKEGVVKAKKRV